LSRVGALKKSAESGTQATNIAGPTHGIIARRASAASGLRLTARILLFRGLGQAEPLLDLSFVERLYLRIDRDCRHGGAFRRLSTVPIGLPLHGLPFHQGVCPLFLLSEASCDGAIRSTQGDCLGATRSAVEPPAQSNVLCGWLSCGAGVRTP
jgi:hypothetical protein